MSQTIVSPRTTTDEERRLAAAQEAAKSAKSALDANSSMEERLAALRLHMSTTQMKNESPQRTNSPSLSRTTSSRTSASVNKSIRPVSTYNAKPLDIPSPAHIQRNSSSFGIGSSSTQRGTSPSSSQKNTMASPATQRTFSVSSPSTQRTSGSPVPQSAVDRSSGSHNVPKTNSPATARAPAAASSANTSTPLSTSRAPKDVDITHDLPFAFGEDLEA